MVASRDETRGDDGLMAQKRAAPEMRKLLDELLVELSSKNRCHNATVRRQVGMLRHHGASWEDIAAALGMHRATAKRTFTDHEAGGG